MTLQEVEPFSPDGHYLPTIKQHSVEKIRLHNYYAQMFTVGMHHRWPNLAYVGLYAGAGAAKVEGTGTVIQTSALSVLNQKVPFTRYVFVESSAECADALRARVGACGKSDITTVLHGDVNRSVPSVLQSLPDYRKEGGVLTFCFVDPFKIDLDLAVIRSLSHLRIDILFMIPLGFDVRRNWKDYIEQPSMRDRLSRFLGNVGWVDEWSRLGRPYTEFPRFIQESLVKAMEALGFLEQETRDIKDIKVAGKNVYLYSLHLFSKSEAARDFWRKALKGTSPQQSLEL